MTSSLPSSLTISDSSCIIALDAIGYLGILERLYTEVYVPQAVVEECGSALPAWFQVRSLQNQALVQVLRLDLGAGEAEAIALSVECTSRRLILDDKKARRIARQLNQPVTGTLAVMLRAKEHGVLSCVRDVIDALVTVNFHVSDSLVQEVLRKAGE